MPVCSDIFIIAIITGNTHSPWQVIKGWGLAHNFLLQICILTYGHLCLTII